MPDSQPGQAPNRAPSLDELGKEWLSASGLLELDSARDRRDQDEEAEDPDAPNELGSSPRLEPRPSLESSPALASVSASASRPPEVDDSTPDSSPADLASHPALAQGTARPRTARPITSKIYPALERPPSQPWVVPTTVVGGVAAALIVAGIAWGAMRSGGERPQRGDTSVIRPSEPPPKTGLLAVPPPPPPGLADDEMRLIHLEVGERGAGKSCVNPRTKFSLAEVETLVACVDFERSRKREVEILWRKDGATRRRGVREAPASKRFTTAAYLGFNQLTQDRLGQWEVEVVVDGKTVGKTHFEVVP